MEKRRRVVVFGIFDGVHDGHRDLFRQALRYAQGKLAHEDLKTNVELIAIVGRDNVAEQLKGKSPDYKENDRIEMLKKEELVNDAVLGDSEISSYKVLEGLNPQVICLGYDQEDLEEDLQNWIGDRNIEIRRAKPLKEDTLHNSMIS